MLSSASKYAIQIVIYLAKNKNKGKIRGKRIAEDLQLGKVLQPLSHSGIIKSTKGPHGGFLLAQKEEAISLMDIIQIYEGDDAFRECLLNSCNCDNYIEQNGSPCKVHKEIAPARQRFLDSLQTKTIADFLNVDIESNTVLETYL